MKVMKKFCVLLVHQMEKIKILNFNASIKYCKPMVTCQDS